MPDSILTVTLQKMAGETIDRIVNVRSEIQIAWRPGVEYANNAFVRPTSPNGFDYQAQNAGRSENLEPHWPAQLAATILDGSITWKCVAPSQSSCDPLSGNASMAIVAPGNTMTVQSTDPNGDVVVRAGGGTSGTDYVNVMSVGTVGGQTIQVRVNVQVRG